MTNLDLTQLSRQHPFAVAEWFETWWFRCAPPDLRRVVLPIPDATPPSAVELAFDSCTALITLAGDADVTDYGSVRGDADPAAAARETAAWLARRDVPWRRFEARNLHPAHGLRPELVRAMDAVQLASAVAPDESSVVLELPDTWEEYLQGLGKRRKHEIVRKQRRFMEAVGTVRFRFADAGTLETDINAFLRLHRESGGVKGAFMTPRRAAFFTDLAEQFLRRGELRLAMLEAGGRVLASIFSFEVGSTLYIYNAGYERSAASSAPGFELNRRIIEDAIARELAVIDFLRGTERYKLDFGGSVVVLEQVVVDWWDML